jgi:hypothetical protein
MAFTKVMSLSTAYLQWYCCTIFLMVLEQLQGRLSTFVVVLSYTCF